MVNISVSHILYNWAIYYMSAIEFKRTCNVKWRQFETCPCIFINSVVHQRTHSALMIAPSFLQRTKSPTESWGLYFFPYTAPRRSVFYLICMYSIQSNSSFNNDTPDILIISIDLTPLKYYISISSKCNLLIFPINTSKKKQIPFNHN